MDYSLTIITVCYNALDKLERTIDSVIAHKKRYPLKVEHLIVDGASTDGTPQRLKQWLEEGRIEAFVSEPDGGIYDAMNKGIRLARGKVLYFLNADDTLTGENLAVCVEPILRGEVQHSAAPVYFDCYGAEKIRNPQFEYVYLQTPCCHQGYFASAELCRELGGYDTDHYRCIADADFMCRACTRTGMPRIINKPVAVYPTTGFSQNCSFVYLPEYVWMMAAFWPHIELRIKAECHYSALISLLLASRAFSTGLWVLKYGLENSHADLLQTIIRRHIRHEKSFKRKMMLRWLATFCIGRILKHGYVSPLVLKVAKLFMLMSSLSKDNPYSYPGMYSSVPAWQVLCQAIKRRALRAFRNSGA